MIRIIICAKANISFSYKCKAFRKNIYVYTSRTQNFLGALVKMIFIINTVTRHFEGKQVEYTKASS